MSDEQDPVHHKHALAIAPLLPRVAETLQDFFIETAGISPAFIMLIGVDNVVQYVANMPREVSIKLLRDMLERFEKSEDRLHMPAHLDPQFNGQPPT